MTALQKVKFEKILKECFHSVESVTYSEHPSCDSAFVKTKNVMVRFSSYKMLQVRLVTELNLEVHEIIASPMPAQNYYMSYQIDLLPVCH